MTYLPTMLLVPYVHSKHIFRPSHEFEELKLDIAKNGIWEPISVWIKHGEILAIDDGNNRLRAAYELGIEMVPVIARDAP